MAAELLTHFPDRFSTVRRVRILQTSHTCSEEVERHWFHGGRVILKFRGRDCPEDVKELVGGDVQIPENERYSPPQGFYYHSDLVDCQIIENGALLGTVTDVFETGPAGANLVVETGEGQEFMIPMVRQLVLAVNIEKKRIEVKLPVGLTTDL